MDTLNKACAENAIDQKMLDKAFEVWYPSLEQDLSDILTSYPTGSEIEDSGQSQGDESQQIFIEEILELSRNNQKILRNTDARLNDTFLEMKEMYLQNQQEMEKRKSIYNQREKPRVYVKFLSEILTGEMSDFKLEYRFMLVLSIMESDFSWITVAGNQLLNVLNKNLSTEKKYEEILEFQRFVKMTMMNPYIWKSKYASEKSFIDIRRYSDELVHILLEMLEQFKMNLNIKEQY